MEDWSRSHTRAALTLDLAVGLFLLCVCLPGHGLAAPLMLHLYMGPFLAYWFVLVPGLAGIALLVLDDAVARSRSIPRCGRPALVLVLAAWLLLVLPLGLPCVTAVTSIPFGLVLFARWIIR